MDLRVFWELKSTLSKYGYISLKGEMDELRYGLLGPRCDNENAASC